MQQYVCVSLTPNLQPSAPLVRYKREVECVVQASGMRWTILQPSVFMQVWLSSMRGWDIGAGKAMIFGAGTAPMSWISLGDVAEHAVRSLGEPMTSPLQREVGLPLVSLVEYAARVVRA